MSKVKKCYSLSDEVVASISRISSQTATPESVIAEKYLTHCISEEVEMTSAERYHFQRKSINDSLDNVLRLFGINEENGGIQDKFRVALYLAQGNLRGKNREYRNGIIETSIFEILENIREWDNNVWKDLTSHMSYFGKIRIRYFNLYPKLKKNGITKKNQEDILYSNSIDNTKDNTSITNSVTEIKEPEDSNLSDEECLKKKRKIIPGQTEERKLSDLP
jgi:hypothetical protein